MLTYEYGAPLFVVQLFLKIQPENEFKLSKRQHYLGYIINLNTPTTNYEFLAKFL